MPLLLDADSFLGVFFLKATLHAPVAAGGEGETDLKFEIIKEEERGLERENMDVRDRI